MHPLNTAPVMGGGLLAQFLAECDEQGWNPNLDVRMELEELSDEDAETLDGFTVDDFDGLADLSAEELAEISTGDAGEGDSAEIGRLKREAGKRRLALKPWRELARDFDMTVEEIREALDGIEAEPDDKKKPVEKKQRRDRSLEDRANAKVVRAEVKIAAADLFEDPADAALYLDLSQYEVDDDGDLVDLDELLVDLKEVLERKPHLAKSEKRKGPKPLKSQGRRDATTSGMDAGRERARARFGKSDDDK